MIEKSWNYKVVVYPIVIFFSFLLYYISTTTVDEMVVGKGEVVPSSNTKIIQHLEGGIVEKIFVHEGDKVKKNQALYQLKNSYYISDIKQKKIEIDKLTREKKRLQAQIAFKNSLSYDDNNPLNQNEIDIFNSQMKYYQEQKSIFQDDLDRLRLEKRQKENKISNLRVELKIANENLSILSKLLKGGAASKKQYLAELSKKQSLITQIDNLKSEIPITKNKIIGAMTKISSFKSKMKTKWLEKLSEVNVKLASLKENEVASADREKRQLIKSPVDGIVKKLHFNTIGGIVKSGDKIAEITPIDDSLVIEAKIKTNDRGSLLVGQDVSIEITAYSYSKYGFLKGKLIYISPDTFKNEKGTSYYSVKIKADKYKVAKGKEILPGMVAVIHIKTGKKTILRYILKPLKDIRKNALIEKWCERLSW